MTLSTGQVWLLSIIIWFFMGALAYYMALAQYRWCFLRRCMPMHIAFMIMLSGPYSLIAAIVMSCTKYETKFPDDSSIYLFLYENCGYQEVQGYP